MFKKWFLSAISLLMVLILPGCVISENSFPDKYSEKTLENHPLLGRWTENADEGDALAKNLDIILENGKLVAIQSPRSKILTLNELQKATTNPNTSVYVYDVDVFKYSGMNFVAVKQRSNNSLYFMLFKYTLENNSLLLTGPSDAFIENAVKTQGLSARLEDKNYVLTASSDNILKIFSEAKDNDFTLSSRYEKITTV